MQYTWIGGGGSPCGGLSVARVWRRRPGTCFSGLREPARVGLTWCTVGTPDDYAPSVDGRAHPSEGAQKT